MSKDYYNLLGIAKNANKDEIKKAFREKAHLYHPDKPGGDEKKFKEINEAYQVLGNDEKRQQYDQFGSDFSQQGGFGGGMGWEDIMRQARQGGGSYSNVDFDFGDIFSDLFGGFAGGGRRKTSRRGRDIEVDLPIEFREAIFGVEKKIELFELGLCPHCSGNGAEPGSKITACATCHGQGQVKQVQRTFLGNIQTMGLCPDCQGEGKAYEKVCSECKGQGRLKIKKQIPIKVPAGIDNGITLKMSGAGEAGIKGASSGDLFIHVKVNPHHEFQRDVDDILSQLEITFTQAALGDKINVKTIDGDVVLKIPAGTISGQVFKLKGKGAIRFQHYGHGDHLVTVIIKTPQTLTKQQKQLLEDLQKQGL